MANTLKFNLFMGGLAFLITFVSALSANVWLVSLERAICAFFLFFLIAFPIHWLYRAWLGQADSGKESGEAGQHVDLVAADEQSEAASSEREPEGEEFTPLSAPRVDTKQTDVQPADIANIVRRLTDE
ncbi:MAG: hypothetical protein H0Z34_02025 [Brevibacillus sp.]|nr:hypothetical protein [Brevibacillus sp.]